MLVDTAPHSSSSATTHGRTSSSLGGSFRGSKKQRKIVVAGSRAVGKSAVTIQFAEDRFVENYNPTIESTFQKTIVYNNTRYETDIVDTAGQDEYTIFQPQYALGVDGYVLVYSITNRQSFDVIRVINDKILSSTGNEHVPRILVGNKCDLMGQRSVFISFGWPHTFAVAVADHFIGSHIHTHTHQPSIILFSIPFRTEKCRLKKERDWPRIWGFPFWNAAQNSTIKLVGIGINVSLSCLDIHNMMASDWFFSTHRRNFQETLGVDRRWKPRWTAKGQEGWWLYNLLIDAMLNVEEPPSCKYIIILSP